MNTSGTEIVARKRRLEEILPQIPVAHVDPKSAAKTLGRAGENTTPVSRPQILSKSDTQQILKRFEPLAPVLQKALEGAQTIRREVRSLEIPDRIPGLEPEITPKPPLPQNVSTSQVPKRTSDRIIQPNTVEIQRRAPVERQLLIKAEGPVLPPRPPIQENWASVPQNPPLKNTPVELPAVRNEIAGGREVMVPKNRAIEPQLPMENETVRLEQPLQNKTLPTLPPSVLRPEIQHEIVRPVPTVVHPGERLEGSRRLSVTTPPTKHGASNAEVETVHKRNLQRNPVEEEPKSSLVEALPRPPMRVPEIVRPHPFVSAPSAPSTSVVHTEREKPQAPGLVLRPSISPVSDSSVSATLETQGQTSKPLVIPAAGGEVSPNAVRERTFLAFQRRLRQQQPLIIAEEVRQTIRSLQTHPSNEVLPREQMVQEPRNIGFLQPRAVRPETVARIPFHGDNGGLVPNVNGRENTIQTPETVNRPRLTPSAGGAPAPPLSNINQLRRSLPSNARSRLVALPAVNILDLVL